MTNSDNGGKYGSYEGYSFLPAIAGSTIRLTNLTPRVVNALIPDPTLGAANAQAPALDQRVGPVAMNLLFCEQLR
ncbi:UNVERIFIED_CONTAM: hypothetical protein Sradi_3638100 [Sesamum radiatum]|uniref:Uncharacterized protein n=1 Tax=Sesamum radiatum TaxID=300843 RepID=A0AAW2QIY3_SESRA